MFTRSNPPAQQNFNSNTDTVEVTTPITQDTITFREDGDVVTDIYANTPTDLPSSIYGVIAKQDTRGLEDFLRRPVILSQGSWAVGAAPTTSLGAWSFPDAIFQSAFSEQITRKILGFTLMKARVKVRLQVNSQPSYAGILLLSYVPHADYMTSKLNSMYSTLTSLSGCPHVVMNLANSTSMEFTTPYISPHLYANLLTGQGTFGRLNLQVMSPLTIGAGTTTPVTWTLWASLEDVDLKFPTNGLVTTGYAQVGGEAHAMQKTGTLSGAIGTAGNIASKVLPVLGMGELSKPVEALATTASSIARFFGFSKPSNTGPTTLIMNKPMRGQLAIDGLDTAHKLGASMGTEIQTMSGFAGTDEDEMNLTYIASRPSAIHNFPWNTSATQDTVLATYRCAPSALMWYANTSTPAIPRTRNAEVRMTHAAFLADKYQYCRGDFVYTFHFAKTQLHSGRIRINFKPFVGDLFPGTSVDLNNQPGFTMTEDVDLSVSSTFRFHVPYVSSRPWLLTQWPQMYAPAANLVDAKNFCIGEVEVVVLNQLTAMSTAANAVNVVVFAHMENAAFAVPRRSATLPNLLTAPALARVAEEFPERGIEATRRYTYDEWQRGDVTKEDTIKPDEQLFPIDAKEIGTAQIGGEEASGVTDTQHVDPIPILPAALCQGEIHSSLRQALKRYNLIGYVTPRVAVPTTANPGTSGQWFVIRPWLAATNEAQSVEWVLNSTTATNQARRTNDLYSAVYGNYAFFRGGMRFRIVRDKTSTTPSEGAAEAWSAFLVYPQSRNPGTDPLWTRNEEYPFNSTTLQSNIFNPHPAISQLIDINSTGTTGVPVKYVGSREDDGWENLHIQSLEGGLEFEVPYYSAGHMSTALYQGFNDGSVWANQRNGQFPLPLVIFGSNNAPTTATYRIYRAVADDFSFGGLLGVPRSTVVLEPGPQGPGTNNDGPATAYQV